MNSKNFMIFIILQWNKLNSHDFQNSCVEFYEFRDFRNSGVEYLNFHDFRDYGVELYKFHDFRNSKVK